MTLREAIELNSDIPMESKSAVHDYLLDYVSGVPKELKWSIGSNEDIVRKFAEQSKDLPTVYECLNKLNWYGKD